MSKRAIILINDNKQLSVNDLYRLQLNDIRKFIKKEFNTGDNIIYLYDNNLSKQIYILNDLFKIKEEDNEHNLCLIKIRFKTSGNIGNNTNNLSKTTILNMDQVNKAYFGNDVNLNNSNNNIKMRESNKMMKYKNDYRYSGKNVYQKMNSNNNAYINKINNIQNYKNINTKLSDQINNTSNKNINNKINSNKNINNNISNTSNKNVNIYINKPSSQSINNNEINNSNKKINDINKKDNNMVNKESNNLTGSHMNINNISNRDSMNINDISNNSSKKNINSSSKENSIKQSTKKMKKLNLDLKNKQSKESQVKKDLLKEISGDINDINEDQKIKEELERYKKEQEKEIEILEKELSDLKKENEKILKEGDNNIDDIFLDEKTIENLKNDIINEVSSKIEKEFKKQINEGLKKINEINIKNHEEQINTKFEEIKKQYDDRIDNEIRDINSKIEEIKNKNNENNKIIIHNIDNNYANYPQNRIKTNQKFKREKAPNNYNGENFKEKNSNENINDKINNNYNLNKFLSGNNRNSLNKNIDDGQENVEDEDNNNSGKHIYSFNKPNVNPCNDRKTNINISNLSNNFKKEEPKALNYNNSRQTQIKNQPFQKKKSQEINLLNILTNIFFTNSQMTEINTGKIEEYHLEKLRNEYIKHLNDEKNIVFIFVNNFIKSNLLRLFKSNRYTKNELETVKTKISLILQCIDMNKDYYSAYYYPQMEKGIRNYHSSVEAARRFRKEFNVGEKELNENMLIKYLDENNNDIYQTFGEIYGK